MKAYFEKWPGCMEPIRTKEVPRKKNLPVCCQAASAPEREDRGGEDEASSFHGRRLPCSVTYEKNIGCQH